MISKQDALDAINMLSLLPLNQIRGRLNFFEYKARANLEDNHLAKIKQTTLRALDRLVLLEDERYFYDLSEKFSRIGIDPPLDSLTGLKKVYLDRKIIKKLYPFAYAIALEESCLITRYRLMCSFIELQPNNKPLLVQLSMELINAKCITKEKIKLIKELNKCLEQEETLLRTFAGMLKGLYFEFDGEFANIINSLDPQHGEQVLKIASLLFCSNDSFAERIQIIEKINKLPNDTLSEVTQFLAENQDLTQIRNILLSKLS